VIPPQPIKKVVPVYPEIARKAGIRGTVVLNVQVGTDGKVGGVKVVSGPQALQAAAVHAVRQWRFEPASIDRVQIAGEANVWMVFQEKK
jgi:protein TonB